MSLSNEPAYLTARELAELLRVRERKVYDLAAAGDVPCSRATGKLLFPRIEVDRWLAASSTGSSRSEVPDRPKVYAGSHDPLLDWALGESGSGIASVFDGSLDGLERFAAGEAIATGLHVASVTDTADFDWNEPLVRARYADLKVVLLAFAERERGLIVAADHRDLLSDLASLRGKTLAQRQAGAGSQVLFEMLLCREGIDGASIALSDVLRTESEAALAVLDGRADAAFGLPAMARQYGLGFVPVMRERFDLLVTRSDWFDKPLQQLDTFCRSTRFREKAAALGGYSIEDYGAVRYNAR